MLLFLLHFLIKLIKPYRPLTFECYVLQLTQGWVDETNWGELSHLSVRFWKMYHSCSWSTQMQSDWQIICPPVESASPQYVSCGLPLLRQKIWISQHLLQQSDHSHRQLCVHLKVLHRQTQTVLQRGCSCPSCTPRAWTWPTQPLLLKNGSFFVLADAWIFTNLIKKWCLCACTG